MLSVIWIFVVWTASVSSQIETDFGDFDQVETYTRILLHTKNGSILGGPRADSGPLIIDYPFPIHHTSFDYHHLHQPTSPEYSRPPANAQQPQYSQQYTQAGSSHYTQIPPTNTHEKLASFYHLGAGHGHHSFLYPHKKKKKFLKKGAKYLVPLLITLAAKIAHLLPTLKLILLALFSLVLFAKKAFLVSVGTFLLVLYEHYTSSKHYSGTLSLWKDRDQVHKTNQDVHPLYSDIGGEHKTGSDWWALEASNGTKIIPREGEKWRRWWAPQVKGPTTHPKQLPPQLEEAASLRDRIRNNLKTIFGNTDDNS